MKKKSRFASSLSNEELTNLSGGKVRQRLVEVLVRRGVSMKKLSFMSLEQLQGAVKQQRQRTVAIDQMKPRQRVKHVR